MPSEYPKPSKYSNKVLIGPWINDRANATPYTPEPTPKYSTTYEEHFPPKQNTTSNSPLIWDKIMTSEQSCLFSDVGKYRYPNYFDNFTTLYDLSYNHFPKTYDTSIHRTWRMRKDIHEPFDEYLASFGNSTNYGLVETKREEWECHNSECRTRRCTSYSRDFRVPRAEDYRFQRYFVCLVQSSKMDKARGVNVDLKQHQHRVSSLKDMPQRLKNQCNPITWECTVDMTKGKREKCKEG